jgi:dihydrofolate reductase
LADYSDRGNYCGIAIMSRELLIRDLRELLDSIHWEAKQAMRNGSFKDTVEWITEVLEDHPWMRDVSKNIIIVAWDENRLIGQNGGLPWKIKGDLPFFKKMTMGNPCVMGRNTYESILKSNGKPLPGRDNIIVSRSYPQPQVIPHVYDDLEVALDMTAQLYAPPKDVFIIGGAQIYKSALDADLVDKMFVSEVKGTFEGDTYFPEFDESKWTVSTYAEFEEFTVKEWTKK